MLYPFTVECAWVGLNVTYIIEGTRVPRWACIRSPMEDERDDTGDGRLSNRQDGPSVDSNGSQASDNPSNLSLSCSSSPFESYRGSDKSGAEGSVTVEPYMYEPPASSSGESIGSDDSEDLSRLNNTDR